MNELVSMRRPMIFATRILGLLVIAGMTVAAEETEPTARYEVEIILFRHVDQSRNTPEIPAAASLFTASPLNLSMPELPAAMPPMDNPPADPDQPLVSVQPTEAEIPDQPPAIGFYLLELDPVYPDFVPLRTEIYGLKSVYRRLVNVDAYEPLVHMGWIQPARNSAESVPFRFEAEEMGEDGLSGTITVFRERYLHIDVDLSMKSGDRPSGTPFLFGARQDIPQAYQLKESRRIRGGEIQYFDNPQFGVITRVQELQAAREERGEIG